MNYKIVLLLIITSLGLLTKVVSQESISYRCDFENEPEFNIIIDSNAENLWQIATPQKQYFDSAFSLPKAIVTDSVNFYPSNNLSIFKFESPYYKKNILDYDSSKWMAMGIMFYHKYDTEKMHSGGYVEISYDGGNIWCNVLSDTNPNLLFIDSSYWYGATDTITGGEPCFNGKGGVTSFVNDYQQSIFGWYWQYDFPYWEYDIWLRFVFRSDFTTNNSHEGWLIDNIEIFYYDYLSGIEYTPPSKTIVYPMPILSTSTLTIDENLKPPFTFSIFDISGRGIKKNLI